MTRTFPLSLGAILRPLARLPVLGLRECWLLAILSANAVTRVPGLSEASVTDARQWLFLVLPAEWVLVRWFRGEPWHWPPNPLNRFFLPFTILLILHAAATTTGFADGDPRALLFHILLVVYYYVTVALVEHRPSAGRSIATVVVISAILQAGLAMAQYFIVQFRVATGLASLVLPALHRTWLDSPAEPLFRLNGYRSVGTFFHANLLATSLTLAAPVALAMALTAQCRWHRRFSALGYVVITIGLLCSGSRGALLSAAASASVVVCCCPVRIRLRWGGVGAGVLLALSPLLVRELSTFTRLQQGTSGRSTIWRQYASLAAEQPLLGAGLGSAHRTYITRYGFPSDEDFDLMLAQIVATGNDDGFRGFHAHNVFLHYAAEMGTPAAALLLGFYVCIGSWFARGDWLRAASSPNRGIVVGGFAAVAGNFIHSFFDTTTSFYDPVIGLPLVAILAVMVATPSQIQHAPQA